MSPDILLIWIPFFTPSNFFQTWWILLAPPLAIGISMIYKAMRYREYSAYWRGVAIMTIQILLGMAAMMLGLYVFIAFILPLL